jgi:hypothetical protein
MWLKRRKGDFVVTEHRSAGSKLNRGGWERNVPMPRLEMFVVKRTTTKKKNDDVLSE